VASLLDEGATACCGGRDWCMLLIGAELLAYKVTGGGARCCSAEGGARRCGPGHATTAATF
jgi:hypothetical protein